MLKSSRVLAGSGFPAGRGLGTRLWDERGPEHSSFPPPWGAFASKMQGQRRAEACLQEEVRSGGGRKGWAQAGWSRGRGRPRDTGGGFRETLLSVGVTDRGLRPLPVPGLTSHQIWATGAAPSLC